MFTVRGDVLSSTIWLVELIVSCCAVTTFVDRLWRDKRNKTQHVVMVLGYAIATSLVFSLVFVPNTNPDWDIHGFIVASSVLIASLTEVRSSQPALLTIHADHQTKAYYFLEKSVVQSLEPPWRRFWIVLNIMLVPAPSLISSILFSP